MIDSNLQMSFLIVDKMFDVHPIILKDSYWGEVPSELKDMAHPDVSFVSKFLGSIDFYVLYILDSSRTRYSKQFKQFR